MNALTTTETSFAMTSKEVHDQVQHLQQIMKEVMKEGDHFGLVPGCGNKPALFKAGAEKLGFAFRLAPSFDITLTPLTGGHREYQVVCKLHHMGSGNLVAEGVGCCSTMESKYRYRSAERSCPKCGANAIIKGKEEYGGGFICFAKKGGCGAKFSDTDEAITSQKLGKVDNPDIADVFNTVLKMAKKRAHVDAVITGCAASDILTQDIEENPELYGGRAPDATPAPESREVPPTPAKAAPKPTPANGVFEDFIVSHVATEKTSKGGKPFSVHTFTTRDHGKVETIMREVADLAKMAMENGDKVKLTTEANGNYTPKLIAVDNADGLPF
jgi:hypothetical protein